MRQYEVGQNAIDISDLYKRFSEGRIGIAFKALMRSEELGKYYAENLVFWTKKMCSMIVDDKCRENFERIISNEMLQFNFQIQLISMVFSKALTAWMNGSDDLDVNIINLLNMDSAKEAVEIVQQVLMMVMNDCEGDGNSEIEVVGLDEFPMNDEKPSTRDIPDFRIMKNGGNNKLN